MGWGCSSVVESLPGILRALALVPSTDGIRLAVERSINFHCPLHFRAIHRDLEELFGGRVLPAPLLM